MERGNYYQIMVFPSGGQIKAMRVMTQIFMLVRRRVNFMPSQRIADAEWTNEVHTSALLKKKGSKIKTKKFYCYSIWCYRERGKMSPFFF